MEEVPLAGKRWWNLFHVGGVLMVSACDVVSTRGAVMGPRGFFVD